MLTKLKSLRNHQGFMKYFKNISWLFAEKILRMVVGLFVGIWVTRYLGPEPFGLISYAQSFVGLFTAIASLGLDSIIVRELVDDASKRDVLLGTAFRLKLIGALLVLIALTVAVKLSHQDSLTTLLVFVIASATVFQSFSVIDFYFQAKVLSKYVVYTNIFSLLISSLIKVALILNEAPLLSFAYVILFDSLVLACGFLFVYRYNKRFARRWQFDKKVAHNLLKDSWPLILVSIASMINMRIDQVMLGNMVDFEVVGNYAAAVKIAEIWFVIPVIVGNSIFPAIILAHKYNLILYRKRVFDTVKYMSCFAIPFAVVITVSSNYIIWMLYGEQFKDAGFYLAVYIWTGLPYVALFVLSKVIVIENITKWSLFITVFVVVINISLNYILIPIYGALGAISVTLVTAYMAQLILIGVLYKKTKLFHD